MALRDVQIRLTQIGVIRLGNRVPTGGNDRNGNPKMRPAKLETFRVTSPSRTLIDAVAAQYGGTVQPWQGPSGPEFEVITAVRELAVLIPPQRIDPNYEFWGNGFRARLCDGDLERMRNQPCLCRRGNNGHVHDFGSGECECGAKRECKPTTRLALMLREIPSIGTFKVESHGFTAAAELPGAAEAIENAPVPLPGRLTMELIDRKTLTNAGRSNEKVESRRFWVPRLVMDWLTPGQAYGGQIETVARRVLSGGAQPALGGGDRPELTSTSTAGDPLAELWSQARTATSAAELRAVWSKSDDPELRAFLTERNAKLTAPAAPAQPAPVPPTTATVEALDAEVEPDSDEVWGVILREAGKLGWNTATVKAKYATRMGHDADDANGWQLSEFLTALTSGQVAA